MVQSVCFTKRLIMCSSMYKTSCMKPLGQKHNIIKYISIVFSRVVSDMKLYCEPSDLMLDWSEGYSVKRDNSPVTC